jgi:hypothetical protein
VFETETLIAKNQEERTQNQKKQSEVRSEARKQFSSAMDHYNLKEFLLRLLIALPVLAIGTFLVMRYRNHRFSAFVWGYALFALYVFFVGLVPYLPSYGGYVRTTVGIVLTIVIGYYTIKQLNLYRERKAAELQKSTEERRKEVSYETATNSYKNHSCPSCERDYLLTQNLIKEKDVPDRQPGFCVHCGIKLFDKCANCGQRNFVYFPHCSSCGGTILKTQRRHVAIFHAFRSCYLLIRRDSDIYLKQEKRKGNNH